MRRTHSRRIPEANPDPNPNSSVEQIQAKRARGEHRYASTFQEKAKAREHAAKEKAREAQLLHQAKTPRTKAREKRLNWTGKGTGAGTLPGSISIAKYYDGAAIPSKANLGAVVDLGFNYSFARTSQTAASGTFKRPGSAPSRRSGRSTTSTQRSSGGGTSYRSDISKANQLWASLTHHDKVPMGKSFSGRGSPFFDKIVTGQSARGHEAVVESPLADPRHNAKLSYTDL